MAVLSGGAAVQCAAIVVVLTRGSKQLARRTGPRRRTRRLREANVSDWAPASVDERLRDAGNETMLGVEIARRLLDGHDGRGELLDPFSHGKRPNPLTREPEYSRSSKSRADVVTWLEAPRRPPRSSPGAPIRRSHVRRACRRRDRGLRVADVRRSAVPAADSSARRSTTTSPWSTPSTAY